MQKRLKQNGDHEIAIVKDLILVGGHITWRGAINPDPRNTRVEAAIETMDKIPRTGLGSEERDVMTGLAALPKAIFGTELEPLTKDQQSRLRRKASWVKWGNKTWMRGAAETMQDRPNLTTN